MRGRGAVCGVGSRTCDNALPGWVENVDVIEDWVSGKKLKILFSWPSAGGRTS